MEKGKKVLLALMAVGLTLSIYACAGTETSESTSGSGDSQTSVDSGGTVDSSSPVDPETPDSSVEDPEPAVDVGVFAAQKWMSADCVLDFAAGTMTGVQKFKVTEISGEGAETVISCLADGEEYIFALNENGALEMSSATAEEGSAPLKILMADAAPFGGAWKTDDEYTYVYHAITPVVNTDGYYEWEAFSTFDDESLEYEGTAVTEFAFDEDGAASISLIMSCGYEYGVVYYEDGELQFDDGWWGAYAFLPYAEAFGGSASYLTEKGDKIAYDGDAGTITYNGTAAEYEAVAGGYGSGLGFTAGGSDYLLQRRASGIFVVSADGAEALASYDPERIKGEWSDAEGNFTISVETDDKVSFNNMEYKLTAYAVGNEIAYDFVVGIYTYTIRPIEGIDVAFTLETEFSRHAGYYFLDEAKKSYVGTYTNNLDEVTVDADYSVTVSSFSSDEAAAVYKGKFAYLPDFECIAFVYGDNIGRDTLYMVMMEEGVYWTFTTEMEYYSAYYATELLPELYEMFNGGLESETDVYTTGGTSPETIYFDFDAGVVVYRGAEYGFFWDYEIGMASAYPTIVFITDLKEGVGGTDYIYRSVRPFDSGVAMTSYDTASEEYEYTYYISDSVYQDMLGLSFTYRGPLYDETFILNEDGSFSMATTDTTSGDEAVSLVKYDYFLERFIDQNGREDIIIGFNPDGNLYLYVHILDREYATLFDLTYSRNDILDFIGVSYSGEDTIELTPEAGVKVNGAAVELKGSVSVGADSATAVYIADGKEYTATFTAAGATVSAQGAEAKTYEKKKLTPGAFVGTYTLGEKTIVVSSSAIGLNYELSLNIKLDGSSVSDFTFGFTADGKQQISFSVADFSDFPNLRTIIYTLTLDGESLTLSDGTNTASVSAASWDYSKFLFEDEKTLTDSAGATHTFACLPKKGGKAPLFLYDGSACSGYSVTIAADGSMVLEVTNGTNTFQIKVASDGSVTADYKPSDIPLPPPPPPPPAP